jgi:flagellar hook-length control protein FliK
VVLRAQRTATRQLLSAQLPSLQQALAQRGLEVATLRCYIGEYHPPADKGDWDGKLSITV